MRRPTLANGLPAWLSAPDIALPRLQLTPNNDYWIATIMLGSTEFSRYIDAGIPEISLTEFLSDWKISPESCCKKWFGTDPPNQNKAQKSTRAVRDLSSKNIGI